ncbi:KH domain-containing, RNA-binding, signal transduction-associated protein 1b [Danio rerio]|uniref:KH domain-containing, RNA-binding, signal transduction-associated protein 1 n=1 Tax=Danio rerio TaxID=7955 RepID=Q6NW62_DANRE|nr:KH domain-containing, RNA-binding, signal transduction-associated protein 1b [Danio rerio]AAH67711.1 Zgc:85948 [Danio rerio]AAI55180.1 Zgc:85948 [Danio rerio]|eukprot:NP_998400.1 KH domain-containing, RNA-binding, signal transduction-associated protein 1 [Danio rerio]
MESENKYLPQLLAERDSLDPSFTHAMKLISAEIEKIEKGDTEKDTESYLDLFTMKNIKLKERILIPVKQYPKFNFVGKILGPQGNTIKRLQEETGAKISVLGKGSMRDKNKEEELRKNGEPKYAHLSMELHVFIEVFAPVPDAYMRMAHAMEEIKKFLFPDMMDDICQEQFMEMKFLNGGQEHGGRGRGGPPIRGRGGLPPPGAPRGRGMPPRGGGRGGPPRGGAARGAPAGRGGPSAQLPRGAASNRARPPAPGAPRMPPPPQTQESYDEYSYDESYADTGYESYDSYYSQPQAAETEYYDYGHGETQEGYENYAQDNWNGTPRTAAAAGGKAPTQRQTKPGFREHPYGRY